MTDHPTGSGSFIIPAPSVTGRYLLAVALCIFMTGCMLFRIGSEAEGMTNSSLCLGTVAVPPWLDPMPITVLAYSEESHRVACRTELHEPGPFEILVPPGRWKLFAFGDRNGNLQYDRGEPAGNFPLPILASGQGLVRGLEIILADRNLAVPTIAPGMLAVPGRRYSTLPGAVARLTDPMFSYAAGRKGYWQPLSFFRQYGCNIYFLRPYEPDRIPVLFVHGATGSPLGWRPFFDKLDPERFQPWFFYYPSGASLRSMADILYRKLGYLQERYRLEKVYIAAHSMGGLIVRSMLIEHGEALPCVAKFIAISTPWAGVGMAAAGVKYAPTALPAWRDLEPDSPFTRSIFRRSLPAGIDFYLFFSYKGGPHLFGPNGDGVVALNSELSLRSQLEAKAVFGFDEDHSGILSSRRVLDVFAMILDDPPGRPGLTALNRLREGGTEGN